MQVACLQLADPVPLRIHWPRNADLRMNNMMYKPYGRSQNAKLGANSRDDMASVGIMVTPVSIPARHAIPWVSSTIEESSPCCMYPSGWVCRRLCLAQSISKAPRPLELMELAKA